MTKLKLLILSFGLTLMVSCVSERKVSSHKNYHVKRTKNTYQKPIKVKKNRTESLKILADKVVWSAFKYKGSKYKYGGVSKAGIDCSGLVMVSFKERGISLPSSSYAMSKEGSPISLKEAKRGDLIFFNTNPKKPSRVSHVGLITTVKDGVVHFLHVSKKRGVVINRMNQNYYIKHFAKVRRVIGYSAIKETSGAIEVKKPKNEKPKNENVTTEKAKVENAKTEKLVSLADKIVWSAFEYEGTKYRYGGTTKSGIDCSGFVMVSFKERGVSLPRSSYGMSKEGFSVSLREAKRGDLIFFKTNRRKPRKISHVGLVTDVKGGVVHFLHASTKRGVVLSRMDQNYYIKHFAGVRRVLK